MTRALLALALTGCASWFAPSDVRNRPPNEARAVAIVWNTVYGRSDEPPFVVWIQGKDLTCNAGKGYPSVLGGGCVEGNAALHAITVALPAGARFSETALAHELCHVLLLREGKDPDNAHVGPCFRDEPPAPEHPSGVGEGMEGGARAALRREGL